MAARARLVALLAVMAVLAGCGSSAFNKAGGSQPHHPVVLTLANTNGQTGNSTGSPATCSASAASSATTGR